MLIAGLDEAGRGCIIGPLIVAGVMMKEENLPILPKLRVKDSKLLTPSKRLVLAEKVKLLSEKAVIVKLQPPEIDRVVASERKLHKLNRLEAETMAKIIDALAPDEAYVDAADVIEERFKQHIQENLSVKARIVSEHKADRNHAIVSAASILAKVERDKEISSLRDEFGDFGSGYLADPKTKTFLKEWLRTHTDFPEWVRKSYKPARKLKDEKNSKQTSLM